MKPKHIARFLEFLVIGILMGVTEDRLDMVQASRVVMNLISSDVRSAGLGLRPQTGQFQGLLTGPFTVGGVPFGGAGTLQVQEADATGSGTFTPYAVPTQDLGVRLADGDQATIVDFTGKGSTAGSMTSGVISNLTAKA